MPNLQRQTSLQRPARRERRQPDGRPGAAIRLAVELHQTLPEQFAHRTSPRLPLAASLPVAGPEFARDIEETDERRIRGRRIRRGTARSANVTTRTPRFVGIERSLVRALIAEGRQRHGAVGHRSVGCPCSNPSCSRMLDCQRERRRHVCGRRCGCHAEVGGYIGASTGYFTPRRWEWTGRPRLTDFGIAPRRLALVRWLLGRRKDS